MLTREQLTANINAMETQGASQEEIQGYLDNLPKPSSAPVDTPAKPQLAPASVDIGNIWKGTKDVIKATPEIAGNIWDTFTTKQGLSDVWNVTKNAGVSSVENVLANYNDLFWGGAQKGLKAVGLDTISEWAGNDKVMSKAEAKKSSDEIKKFFYGEGDVKGYSDPNDQRGFLEKLQAPDGEKEVAKIVGSQVPTFLALMGITVLAKGTNIPAIPATLSASFAMNTGDAYQQGKDYVESTGQPMTPELDAQIQKASVLSGIMTAPLDAFGMDRILKPSQFINFKSKLAGSIVNGILDTGVDTVAEGGTEALQEVFQNAWAKTYNANQDLFAGVGEAFFGGGLFGGGSSALINSGGMLRTGIVERMKQGEDEATIKADVIKGAKEAGSPITEAKIDEAITDAKKVYDSVVTDITDKLDRGVSPQEVALDISQHTDIDNAVSFVNKVAENHATQSTVVEDTTKELNALSEKVDKSVLKKTAVDLQNDFERVQAHIDEQVKSIREEVDTLKQQVDNAPDRSTEKKRLKITLENKRGELRDAENSFTDKVVSNAKSFRSFITDYAMEQGATKEQASQIADTTSDIVTSENAGQRTVEDIVAEQLNTAPKAEIKPVSTKNRQKGAKNDEKVSKVATGKKSSQVESKVKRKEKIKELSDTYVTGKKLNEGLNVEKIAIEDNRSDKTKDGVEKIKEVIGYKTNKTTSRATGEDIEVIVPQVITEIVDDEPVTQKEKVKKVVEKKGKATIKEIADETGILEPNVRRILGMGAKEGEFKRIESGVYTITTPDGKEVAVVIPADAVETLPKLASEGFKSDMVFLDIPYDTPAVKGGNRGVDYNLISVEDFAKVLDALAIIMKEKTSPVIHMFSQAESGMAKMQKYNDLFLEKGFIPVGRGEYQKTYKDGSPVAFPTVHGSMVTKPEGIIVFTQSGEVKKDLGNLNFKLVRPKGYATEKHADMLKSLIEMTTEEGDVILDPFAGSGVTGAEAVKAGRKAVLIEKDAEVAKTITKPRVEGAIKDYTEGMSKLQKSNVDRVLGTKIRLDGKVMTKKESVEKFISEGYVPKTFETNKIKDPTRTQFNRMNQQEQDAFERKQKEAGKKIEYTLYNDGKSFDVTKIEYDYATSLVNKEVAKDTNVPTKTEKIYHGTPHTFDKFDVSLSGGSIWFTNKKETISDTGLSLSSDQKLNVMERLMPSTLKLADEDLNDKLTKDQLIQEGYDGVRYDNGNGEYYYEIFDPENTLLKEGEKTLEEKAILHKKPSYSDPVEAVVNENLMSEVQFYLEALEAGRRIFVPQRDSMDYEIRAVSSTFPQFVPEKWRSRKTFDQLRPYWEAQERPSKKTPALQALYDVFTDYVSKEMPKRIEEVKKAQENRVVEDSNIPFKVQDEANLVVHHNLTEGKLIHADELGGFPVPSVAISNKDNVTSAFGDIILIGNKELIDPTIKSNKVYNADSYSARYPTVQYEVANRKLLDTDFKKAKEYFSDKDVIRDYEESEYMAQSVQSDGGKYSVAGSRGVKAMFAMEKGASKDMTREQIETFSKDNSDEFASFVKGIKNDFGITSSLFNGYTYGGQRRKGLPHTLENVVKKMKGTGRTDEGFNYGVGSLRSAVAKKFKNIKQIQSDRSKLISSEEMIKLKEETSNEFDELMTRHNVNDHFRFSDNIVDYELGKISATELKQYTGIDDEAIKDFEEFGKKLAQMPSEYFEAKLQRAVDINEFKVAVVPEDISKEAEDILIKNGLTIEKYGKNNRQEAIDKATVDGGALFKIKKYKFDTDYSVRDASNYLNDLKSRLGIDFDVNFVDSILVDYKVDPLKKTKEKRFAYGVYLDNTIAIANDIASYTAEHESVHLTLANMYRIQAFKNEGLTKDKVMQAMANQMGVVLSDKTKLDVEEQIAYDFELYTHDRKAWADEIAKRTGEKPSSILAKFYEVLKNLIKKFAEAISITEGDIIKNYYEILADGVENNKQMLKFQNNGLIQSYIEDGELSIYTLEKEKSEALSKFKLREESDAYLQKTKKTFNELVDKSQKLITDTEAWKADIDKKLIEKAKTAEIVDETRADVKEASRFTTRNKPPVGSLTKRGEEIVTTLDFKNKDEAQKEISDYLLRKTQLVQTVKQLRALSLQISNAKKEGKATRKELRDVARRLKLRKKLLEQKEFYVNMGKGQGKKEAFSMIQKRNRVIRDTQELFGISDAKAKELIGSKRINQMSEKQFNEFLTWFTNNAQLQSAMQDARDEVTAILFEKQFQKEDNLRKSLGLPPLNQMTEAQATMYAGILYTYQFGDVFLTKREMETSARTKYEEIKTERELIDKIEEVAGIPRGELKTIDATSSDRYKNWFQLSKKNLFYDWLVGRNMIAKTKEIQQVYMFRRELDTLTRNARKSRSSEKSLKDNIWDFVAPTDAEVFEALNTGDFSKLTTEEKLLADFLTMMFRTKYDNLTKNFKDFKGRENYVTHMSRDFFETLKDTGSLKEAYNIFRKEQKDTENAVEILAGQTGEILAFDKFLPYMLKRSDKIIPSKNVSRIALTYFTATTRKELLDEFIPEAMLTLHGYKVLNGQTAKGLDLKPFLETFTKEYLNNAKGRRIDFITRQGSDWDTGLMAFTSWISFKYIGGNPILAFMNLFGDLVALSAGTTNAQKVQSVVRSFKSNNVDEAIRGLIGHNPLVDLLNTQTGLFQRILPVWFSMMSSTSYLANKFTVKGLLTEEEFKTGIITDERIQEMARQINKFKLTDSYGRSLVGSTTAGKASLQFKTWAVPFLITGIEHIKSFATILKEKGFNPETKKDAIELARIVIIGGLMYVAVQAISNAFGGDDDKDNYLWKQIENNLNTIYGILSMPFDKANLAPVVIGEINAMQDLLLQLATQEAYAKPTGKGQYAGDLKALQTLKKIIVPAGATRVFNIKPDERTPSQVLIDESLKNGEFDAENIAMMTSMNWGDKTQEQRESIINEITRTHTVLQKYPNSKVASIILGEKNNKDRVAKLIQYSEKVGIDATYEEMKTMMKDKELYSNQKKYTGAFISAELFRDFQLARKKLQTNK